MQYFSLTLQKIWQFLFCRLPGINVCLLSAEKFKKCHLLTVIIACHLIKIVLYFQCEWKRVCAFEDLTEHPRSGDSDTGNHQ